MRALSPLFGGSVPLKRSGLSAPSSRGLSPLKEIGYKLQVTSYRLQVTSYKDKDLRFKI